EGGADPVQRHEHRWRREHRAAQSERDEEHHEAHAGADAEQARQAAQHADRGAGGGAQHVARPRRAGRACGEETDSGGLFRCHDGGTGRANEGGAADMGRTIRSRGPARLERSCAARRTDWMQSRNLSPGLQALEAWFGGRGYDTHRPDVYGISLTDAGLQGFDYRRARPGSTPGQILVLPPHQAHHGRAGTPDGVGYRIVYVAPAHVAEAVRALCGRPCSLPFAREPVIRNTTLAEAVVDAFRDVPEPLAVDGVVLRVAEALLDIDRSCGG